MVVGFHPDSTCRGWGLGCASGLWIVKAWKCNGKSKNLSWDLLLQPNRPCAQPGGELSTSQAVSEASKQFTFFYTSLQVFNWSISNSSVVNQLFENEPKPKRRCWMEKNRFQRWRAQTNSSWGEIFTNCKVSKDRRAIFLPAIETSAHLTSSLGCSTR